MVKIINSLAPELLLKLLSDDNSLKFTTMKKDDAYLSKIFVDISSFADRLNLEHIVKEMPAGTCFCEEADGYVELVNEELIAYPDNPFLCKQVYAVYFMNASDKGVTVTLDKEFEEDRNGALDYLNKAIPQGFYPQYKAVVSEYYDEGKVYKTHIVSIQKVIEIFETIGVSSQRTVYRVKLAENVFVDVMHTTEDGQNLFYVMALETGEVAFNLKEEPISINVDENAIVAFVRNEVFHTTIG